MARDHDHRFEHEFRTALEEFHEIKRLHTRRSIHGEEYVLVDNVTEQLERRSPSNSAGDYEHDLDRLGKTAYLRHDSSPPRLRTSEYEKHRKHLPVFYTLLDIGAPSLIDQFTTNKDLESLPVLLSALKDGIEAPSEFPDFHDEFFRRQFSWCPVKFDMRMGQAYGHHAISPFIRKSRISRYREGGGSLSSMATLYEIDVPEELVGPGLRRRMASTARIERSETEGGNDHNGSRYRFALKQFSPRRYDHFKHEMEMFRNLENHDGVIQYLGWFQNSEPDEKGGRNLFWNIVLELAELDFYTAVRKELPPTSIEEISGFWNTMAGISEALASIHTVDVDRLQYLFWHGDIKPENILRVDGRYKLADLGESIIMLKSPQLAGPQKTKLLGGTRSYGAPEKAAYLDGTSTQQPLVTQTSDVWSLGCVFSIAATYVVLGTKGVMLYSQFRRQAVFDSTGKRTDAFHDGFNALEEVRQWHTYLRETAQGTDTCSARVLDIVDKCMLVNEDERWSAQAVSKELKSLLMNS